MNAQQTQQAIRAAMEAYKHTVLAPSNWNADKGIFQYPYRISEAEVLRLAGIKSRSTLVAEHHAEIKSELADLIRTLKLRTGKGQTAAEKKESSDAQVCRLEQFAQIIAAQDYKIRALQQELDSMRSGETGVVTNITAKK